MITEVAFGHETFYPGRPSVQGQRAGKAGTAAVTYPQVWKWKEEAFKDACKTLREVVAAEGGPSTKGFAKWPGTFEAGSKFLPWDPVALTTLASYKRNMHSAFTSQMRMR